jgi:lysophospholipase L1-like esterase
MHTNSTDVATPAAKGVTCTGTDYTIYYLKQSGGGSFNYSIDSGSATTVSTVNTSNALGTINIGGQTLAQHSILMTLNTAGTTGVTLFGVDCNIANSGGIKVDKLGMSGSRGSHWAAANAGLWQSEITQLNPSVVIITLGTNDISSVSVSNYIANIETIIGRIRVVKPTVPIILTPPTIGTRTGPAGDVGAYFPSLQDLARQNGYGYVEVSKFTGAYVTANAAGLWIDGVHMTTTGDKLFADVLIDYLGITAAPTITSVTGNNPQNITGGESITINGTNFVDLLTSTAGITTAAVTIGGVAATNIAFVSSEKLTATAPAHAVGTADVVVTNYTQSATCYGCMTYNTDPSPTPSPTLATSTATSSPTTTTSTSTSVTATSATLSLLKMGTINFNEKYSQYYYTGHRPTFSGIASPNSSVTVTIHSDPITCSTITDNDGNWSCTPSSDIPNGDHTVTIQSVGTDGQYTLASFKLGINIGLAATGDDVMHASQILLLVLVCASFLLIMLPKINKTQQ